MTPSLFQITQSKSIDCLESLNPFVSVTVVNRICLDYRNEAVIIKRATETVSIDPVAWMSVNPSSVHSHYENGMITLIVKLVHAPATLKSFYNCALDTDGIMEMGRLDCYFCVSHRAVQGCYHSEKKLLYAIKMVSNEIENQQT